MNRHDPARGVSLPLKGGATSSSVRIQSLSPVATKQTEHWPGSPPGSPPSSGGDLPWPLARSLPLRTPSPSVMTGGDVEQDSAGAQRMWAPRRRVSHCGRWHLHTLVSGGGTYEVPDGPSSWAKGVRAVALGLALWPTGCVSGFEGVQASCLSLMVPRHTCATADEGGRWEPPARLSFPTGGWTRPLALKHSSPFSSDKSLRRSAERGTVTPGRGRTRRAMSSVT